MTVALLINGVRVASGPRADMQAEARRRVIAHPAGEGGFHAQIVEASHG